MTVNSGFPEGQKIKNLFTFLEYVLLWKYIFKLRLGALIPRSVGPPKITKKNTKLYKTLQNIKYKYKMIGKEQTYPKTTSKIKTTLIIKMT